GTDNSFGGQMDAGGAIQPIHAIHLSSFSNSPILKTIKKTRIGKLKPKNAAKFRQIATTFSPWC
ncbi:MAG: hypothetical protein KDC92_10995, partial [Bacteroidetes bacterium]|nr:hypothetical protein [Bacteroidota bacterium]